MERSSAAAVGSTNGSTGTGKDRTSGMPDTDTASGGRTVTAAGAGTAGAWAALDGEPELLGRVSVTERPGLLASRLPVLELARSTVAVCALAAAELSCVREPAGPKGAQERQRVPAVHVDDGAVAAAFTSERHLLIDGRAPADFAPLSRFWPTGEGWLRTHANYPHHRARLLAALGLDDTGDDAALAASAGSVLEGRRAAEVEETVNDAGGLAVAVRERDVWAQHAQGSTASARPLLSLDRLDNAAPLPLGEADAADGPAGVMSGLRVLDLTRVVAGPVATRTLAQLGADVLRLDSPHLPEHGDAHADTGFGKRSALLDLSSRAGQSTFEELLSSADVVLTGYRPGALDRYGLAPESLADRRPGLVVGQLSAWGAYGPWHRRRGFDSLVQAASGIAVCESDDGSAPGALPAQALDHGTGYLLAAAVLRALTEQRSGRSGSRVIRVALTQTASWLLNGLAPPRGSTPASPGSDGPAHDPAPWLGWTDSPLGQLRHALPPVAYEGGPTSWPRPPGLPGGDASAWW